VEGAFSEVRLNGFLGSSLRFLADHTLRVFAYYRFALAAVAVVLLSSVS
jgi:undecaprenyl pyrophosphate phosphatase UppP